MHAVTLSGSGCVVMASGAIGGRGSSRPHSASTWCLDNIRMCDPWRWQPHGRGVLLPLLARMVAGESREVQSDGQIGPDSEVDEWAAGVLAFLGAIAPSHAASLRNACRAAVCEIGYLLSQARGSRRGRRHGHGGVRGQENARVSHGLDLCG